jgi:hypothetical protein
LGVRVSPGAPLFASRFRRRIVAAVQVDRLFESWRRSIVLAERVG